MDFIDLPGGYVPAASLVIYGVADACHFLAVAGNNIQRPVSIPPARSYGDIDLPLKFWTKWKRTNRELNVGFSRRAIRV